MQKNNSIGVILPNVKEDSMLHLINGIEDIAYKNGYVVLIAQCCNNACMKKRLITAMQNQRINGLIIYRFRRHSNCSQLDIIYKYNIPVVVFRNFSSDIIQNGEYHPSATESVLLKQNEQINYLGGKKAAKILFHYLLKEAVNKVI
jgi:DNA-binding LacI/PurR family transcriptional regulator